MERTETEKYNILRQSVLFADASEKTCHLAAKLCRERCCPAGEVIFASGKAERVFGVVVSGGVTVTTRSNEHAVTLRTIEPRGIFGAASLYGGIGMETTLTARGETTLLLLYREEMQQLLTDDPAFALAFIAILSDRVSFLNRKIAAFTAGSTHATVAQYLLQLPPDEDGNVHLPPLLPLSAQLGMGRASLYRALDSMAETGLIVRRNARTLRIPDRMALEGK